MRTILRSPQTPRLGWLPPAVLAQGSAQRGDHYQQVRAARDGITVQAREPHLIGTFEEIASENPAARPGARRAPRLGTTRPLANVRSGSRAAIARRGRRVSLAPERRPTPRNHRARVTAHAPLRSLPDPRPDGQSQ